MFQGVQWTKDKTFADGIPTQLVACWELGLDCRTLRLLNPATVNSALVLSRVRVDTECVYNHSFLLCKHDKTPSSRRFLLCLAHCQVC